METQTLNKIDFKKYLLEKLQDSRQEEFIFWKKSIPLPIDLVYKIFDQRGELFKIFLDHLSTVTLYYFCAKEQSNNSEKEIVKLPNELNKSNHKQLHELYSKYYSKSKIKNLTKNIAEKLLVVEYDFSYQNFIDSICHEGRKYPRLYLPIKIKETLGAYDKEIFKYVGISNGDMFGNIVADQLGVYRSGFSDAFAAIFNRLLDFILEKSSDKQISLSTASKIKVSQFNEPETLYPNYNIGNIVDGSLWEPRYIDAKSSFLVNSKHPYFEIIANKTGEEVLLDIVSQSALIENEVVRDATSKILEDFRHEISRKLRLIAERT